MAQQNTGNGFNCRSNHEIDFVTFGMFIIDEIEFEPPRPPVKDILGGAGTFGAVGARITAGPKRSKSVGWIVDAGSDFPPEVRSEIEQWNTSCIIREDEGRLTTRGWNGYIDDRGTRAFKYLTPKARLDENSYPDSYIFSKSFHLICSPLRCIKLCQGIMQRRRELDPNAVEKKPLIVWEPVPDLCVSEEKENFFKALQYVDIVSPNEGELAGLFGRKMWEGIKGEGLKMVAEILHEGIGPEGKGVLVVRNGKNGSFALSRSGSFWVPAYHQTGDSVVDPTGAGNTYLGALAQAMVSDAVESEHIVQKLQEVFRELDRKNHGTWDHYCEVWEPYQKVILGMIWGNIAAGIAVEQVGMPKLGNEDGIDLWNKISIGHRVKLYSDLLLRLLPPVLPEIWKDFRCSS